MKNKGLLFSLLAIAIVVGAYFILRNQGETAAPENTPTETAQAPAQAPAQASPLAAETPAASSGEKKAVDLTVDAHGLSKATVVMGTDKGTIRFKFYPEDAPKTVARIIELIQSGFYNGLNFHRVVPGFVVQGGDPRGNGTGGSGTKLKAEFNKRLHVEGTVAMARAMDPDSADSQFYICLAPQPSLDGNYTVFGQVVQGMDIVKKIAIGDKITTVTIE